MSENCFSVSMCFLCVSKVVCDKWALNCHSSFYCLPMVSIGPILCAFLWVQKAASQNWTLYWDLCSLSRNKAQKLFFQTFKIVQNWHFQAKKNGPFCTKMAVPLYELEKKQNLLLASWRFYWEMSLKSAAVLAVFNPSKARHIWG